MQIVYKIGLMVGAAIFVANAQAEGFSKDQICKAAISMEMFQDVGIMKTVKSGDIPEIQYIRKDDGEKFIYRCNFSGDRVIWSTYFDDPVSKGWGRWRDDEYDAVLTYKVDGAVLSVHSTEINATKTFAKEAFK